MILKNCDAGIHYPHVDADKDHLVFLYYVNDSDGDTIFFNEKYDGSKIDNLTVMSRVSPESGKAVVFDGRTYHASSSPSIGDYRCVINIDFIGSL
jgi:ectoine hydroxylase-related dioxygenase (phytanoyl-CoA dioxygenase family)